MPAATPLPMHPLRTPLRSSASPYASEGDGPSPPFARPYVIPKRSEESPPFARPYVIPKRSEESPPFARPYVIPKRSEESPPFAERKGVRGMQSPSSFIPSRQSCFNRPSSVGVSVA